MTIIGRLRGERGVVMLQVMVMAIVLATISMMMIQWQYGRYVTAYRHETNGRAKDIAAAAMNQVITNWIKTGVSDPTAVTPFTINDPVLGPVTATVTTACGTDTANYKTFCVTVTVN